MHPDSRHELFREERRLIEALASVRTKMNEFAPVSTLPTEVLESVFAVCVSWLYEPRKPERRLAWTQVCRRWRCISLNAVRLWQSIDLCDPRLAHEFLLRSASAPLRLISTAPRRLFIQDGLQPLAPRVKSVDVLLFPEEMTELFTSLGPTIPTLTSLSLKVPPVATNFVLPISASLPRLRQVLLDCVSIPWNLCTNLTHLHLRGLGAGFSPSLLQLLAIIESSPLLQDLRLGCISPQMPHSAGPPTHSISLPHLRTLVITAKAPVIHAVLSALTLPPTARLQIGCSQFEGLSALFPPFSKSTTASLYTGLKIGAVRLEREGVRFFPPHASAKPWPEEPSDTIVSFGAPWPISKNFLPDVPRFFDLGQVTALELGAAVLFDITHALLVSFLAQLPSLEALRIAFSASLADLLRALSGPPPGRPFLCPRLHTISFGRAHDEVWWHFDEEWLPLLLALARARHTALIPLAAVEFTRCHGVSPQMCDDFGALVGRVSVDRRGWKEAPARG